MFQMILIFDRIHVFGASPSSVMPCALNLQCLLRSFSQSFSEEQDNRRKSSIEELDDLIAELPSCPSYKSKSEKAMKRSSSETLSNLDATSKSQTEASRKPPPAKKSRDKKRSLELDSSIELPIDALCQVMEFLSPRQLYNLAFSCKNLQGFITTQLVIKSALIHGGHAKQTVKELYDLMSKKAMHGPSPLRLLRLVNGKRCEICCKCAVNHVRPKLGVFACWTCTTERGLTCPLKWTWAKYRKNRNEYEAIFGHDRVASNNYGNTSYLWAKPRTARNGEPIGPLVTFGDIDKMFEHTSNRTNGKKGTLDSYIETNLLTSSYDTEEAYQEFNSTYEETMARSRRLEKERDEKKDAKQRKARENKLAKIEKMVQDLDKLLKDPYRGGFVFAKQEMKDSYGAKEPIVRFDLPFVDELLKTFVISPSKVRKKMLAGIASTINEKLSILTTTNFASLEFLSDEHACEMALKSHFKPKVSDLKTLFEMKGAEIQHRTTEKFYYAKDFVNEQFFNLLKKEQFIAALAHLLQGNLSGLFVASNNTDPLEEILASTLWFHCLGRKLDSDDQYHTAYGKMIETWPKTRDGFRGYKTWLEEKFSAGNLNDEQRCWYPRREACRCPSLLNFLMAEDFEALDKEASRGFDSYMWNNFWR